LIGADAQEPDLVAGFLVAGFLKLNPNAAIRISSLVSTANLSKPLFACLKH